MSSGLKVKLLLKVLHGEIRNKELLGKQSPYVSIIVGDSEYKSPVAHGGHTTPTWNHLFEFDLSGWWRPKEIVFQVFGKSKVLKDSFVGGRKLTLNELMVGVGLVDPNDRTTTLPPPPSAVNGNPFSSTTSWLDIGFGGGALLPGLGGGGGAWDKSAGKIAIHVDWLPGREVPDIWPAMNDYEKFKFCEDFRAKQIVTVQKAHIAAVMSTPSPAMDNTPSRLLSLGMIIIKNLLKTVASWHPTLAQFISEGDAFCYGLWWVVLALCCLVVGNNPRYSTYWLFPAAINTLWAILLFILGVQLGTKPFLRKADLVLAFLTGIIIAACFESSRDNIIPRTISGTLLAVAHAYARSELYAANGVTLATLLERAGLDAERGVKSLESAAWNAVLAAGRIGFFLLAKSFNTALRDGLPLGAHFTLRQFLFTSGMVLAQWFFGAVEAGENFVSGVVIGQVSMLLAPLLFLTIILMLKEKFASPMLYMALMSVNMIVFFVGLLLLLPVIIGLSFYAFFEICQFHALSFLSILLDWIFTLIYMRLQHQIQLYIMNSNTTYALHVHKAPETAPDRGINDATEPTETAAEHESSGEGQQKRKTTSQMSSSSTANSSSSPSLASPTSASSNSASPSSSSSSAAAATPASFSSTRSAPLASPVLVKTSSAQLRTSPSRKDKSA